MMTADRPIPPGWHVTGQPDPGPALCTGSGQARLFDASTPCPVCAADLGPGAILPDHRPRRDDAAPLNLWSLDR